MRSYIYVLLARMQAPRESLLIIELRYVYMSHVARPEQHSLVGVRTISVTFVGTRSSILPGYSITLSLRNNWRLHSAGSSLSRIRFHIRDTGRHRENKSMVKLEVVDQFKTLECTYLELHVEWPFAPWTFQQIITGRQSFLDSRNLFGSKSLRAQEMMQL